MICPKCNSEYRDEFTTCSDCGVNLVEKTDKPIEKLTISLEGIRLVKFGIVLLFIALTKLMIVIITYVFYIMYMQTHGFMMDYIFIKLINPIFWYIFTIEIVVSIVIILWGISFKEKTIKYNTL
jgi:hypothetical protein